MHAALFTQIYNLSLDLTDIAISINNTVKHFSTRLNGVEFNTQDRVRVLAQGRIVDRHGTEKQRHQQLLSDIAHARTCLHSVEARASAIQWTQPHIMRELCSLDALRNLTSHTSLENAKSVLTRSIQNHRRSRYLPSPTVQDQWVCGQAVHRFQNPAMSKGLCARQTVPARRATDLPPATHSSRTSMPPLHSTCPRPIAVPSSLSSASSPPCASAGGARQSKLTPGTMFVGGPVVAEPHHRTYAPFPGAPATGVVDAMSVLVEFLEVAQLVLVLHPVPPAVHARRRAQGARNGGL